MSGADDSDESPRRRPGGRVHALHRMPLAPVVHICALTKTDRDLDWADLDIVHYGTVENSPTPPTTAHHHLSRNSQYLTSTSI